MRPVWPVSPSLGLTFSFKILRNHGLFLETQTESGVSSCCDPCVQTRFTHFYEFSFSPELEAVVEGQGRWEECGRHREAGCGGERLSGPTFQGKGPAGKTVGCDLLRVFGAPHPALSEERRTQGPGKRVTPGVQSGL